MITVPTLLVLGAGASIPCGYPSGIVLRDELRELARVKESSKIYKVLEPSGFSLSAIHDFGQSFRDSGINSIDAFVDRRKEYEQIAKLCIAREIASREEWAFLYPPTGSDDWYGYLWNRMMEGASSAAELARNAISIVTFNYDRSLEAFLFTSIRNTFGLSDSGAFDTVRKLSIEHMYGHVGTVWSDGNDTFFPYFHARSNDDRRAYRAAAEGIHLMPGVRDDIPSFDKAREWFRNAERVCFLGFGFDSLNCRRLSFTKEITAHNRSPRVFATTYGLYGREAHDYLNAVTPGCTSRQLSLDTPTTGTLECAAMLRRFGVLV
jgi:hypothetical protein